MTCFRDTAAIRDRWFVLNVFGARPLKSSDVLAYIFYFRWTK